MANQPSYLVQTTSTLLDALCDDFEAAWQSGACPNLAAYLDRVPAEGDARLFRELLLLEVEYRGKRGDQLTADEYRSRFPAHLDVIAEVFADTSLSSGPASGATTIDLGRQEIADPSVTEDHVPGDEESSRKPTPAGEPVPAGEPGTRRDRRPHDDSSAAPEAPAHIGRYQILGRLGGGGMGVVYRARHTALGKTVALKVLPKLRIHDPESVRRFQREMIAVGRLEHPHIVTAHDAGEADGVHYLTMELVEGSDFARLLKSRGTLGIADVCELVRQAAAGLAYVHEQGLVHRDVKPSNLMLAHGGQVKVLDLGLALVHQSEVGGDLSTSSNAALGTVDYMAPEQTGDAHRVDPRADIYSLGCTLFFLLAGRPPFCSPQFVSTPQKMLAHVQCPPPSIASLRADVPPALAVALERALAKNPNDRFATMDEFAAALTPLATGADTRRLQTDLPRKTVATPGPAAEKPPGAVPQPVLARGPLAFRRPAAFLGGVACLAIVGYWFVIGRSGGSSQSPEGGRASASLPEQLASLPSAAGRTSAVSTTPSAAPQATSADTKAAKSPRDIFQDLQHKATEEAVRWVAAQGGFAHGYIDYVLPLEYVDIKSLSDVPTRSFTVTAVKLSGIKTVDDAALENISKLRLLCALDLDDTAVSDDGLLYIQKWPRLSRLVLTNTRVTDKGLESLQTCKFLAYLKLTGTQVTEDGVARLKSAFPKCAVEK
jgi:hypothetical protein